MSVHSQLLVEEQQASIVYSKIMRAASKPKVLALQPSTQPIAEPSQPVTVTSHEQLPVSKTPEPGSVSSS